MGDIILGEGINELNIQMVPIAEPPPGIYVGIRLINAPPQATTWRWTVCLGNTGRIKDSKHTSIGNVAYAAQPPVPLPNSLCLVMVWHESYVIDGIWEGEILISEYGIYEFDWITHTLTMVG